MKWLLFLPLFATFASAQVSEAQLEKWLKRFPSADANQDGTLTRDEAKAFRDKMRVGTPARPRGSQIPKTLKVHAGWDDTKFPAHAMCNKPPDALAEAYGHATPNLPKPTDGSLRIVGTGHSFMAPGYKSLPSIVKAAGFTQAEPPFTHTGGGVTGSARYKWEQENGIFAFDGRATPKLLAAIANAEWDVMMWGPYFHDRPAYYLCWTRFCLKHNPAMCFYLSDAWPQIDQLHPIPTSEKELGSDVIRKMGAEKNEIFKKLVNALRDEHPGRVFIIPTSDAMVLAAEAYHRGELPGVNAISSFVSKKSPALWRDRLGHLGPGFDRLEGYVFYAALYRRSPALIEGDIFKGNPAYPSRKLDRVFREIAWKAVTAHPFSGVTDEDGDGVADRETPN